jgi:hypothetical protein
MSVRHCTKWLQHLIFKILIFIHLNFCFGLEVIDVCE